MRTMIYKILVLSVLLMYLPGCKNLTMKVPSLKETYRNDDKNPFGGYVAYNIIKNHFDNVRVLYGNDRLIDGDREIHGEGGERSLYVIISDRIMMTEEDADWAIRYVEKGNDLLLSANTFSRNILKKSGVMTNQTFAQVDEYWGKMKDAKVNIYFGKNLPVVPFSFYYYGFKSYLQSYVRQSTVIQGTNEKDQPNFAIIFIGKGRLYLHLAPRSLGNYFLLTGDNIDYLNHIINFLRPDPAVVYWDEFYKRLERGNDNKKNGKKNFSSLHVIMDHPFLKWAFLIAVAGFLMFLFSNMKRRQRVIPKQMPASNASVDFVETVARLYYVNKNNKKIAEKLISYFYEYVRSRYFLRGTTQDDVFSIRLAGKKGMTVEEIRELINCIKEIENQLEVSDEQLLKLNQLLEKFYNHK